jgi:biphenyl-2,3-diol 1,2-dioxygenase
VHKVDELAYIGINAKDLEAWSAFAADVLGFEVCPDSDSDNLYLRMDINHHRFIVHPSGNGSEDVSYIGWQVRNATEMRTVAEQVETAGVSVTEGSAEEAAVRRVLGLVHFEDPHSKLRMEVSYGPQITYSPPFKPGRPIDGFLTGDLGLGHVVTYVPDVEAAERFYSEALGFATSDTPTIPGVGRVGCFMYCNPRHHSLAFFANPEPQRCTNHVMLEHTTIDDVGSAYDICRDRELIKVELGRHNNDRMFSFYATNPSGWYFEVGWGARQIDPETFAVEHYSMGGSSGMGEWGHRGITELI